MRYSITSNKNEWMYEESEVVECYDNEMAWIKRITGANEVYILDWLVEQYRNELVKRTRELPFPIPEMCTSQIPIIRHPPKARVPFQDTIYSSL